MNRLLSLIFVVVFIYPTILSAVNLFWIGGDGLWNDGNNWSLTAGGASCGCIPGPADHAIIGAAPGTIRCVIPNAFDALASSVQVNTGTSLEIGDQVIIGSKASLTIEDPTSGIGMVVFGNLFIYDTLRILDASLKGLENFTSGGTTIDGQGVLEVGINDGNTASGIDNKGHFQILRNLVGRRGRILVKKNTANAIFNFGVSAEFTNNGLIIADDFLTPPSNVQYALVNDGGAMFTNATTGRVTLILPGSAPVSSTIWNNSSTLVNQGEINLAGSLGSGVFNFGTAVFSNQGIVNISDFGFEAINNRDSAKVYNHGQLNISQGSTVVASKGINNTAYVFNSENANITITDFPFTSSIGHAIANQDSFVNEGIISIKRLNGGAGIRLNADTAFFINHHLIDVDSTGIGVSITTGTFENYDSVRILRTNNRGILMFDGNLQNHSQILIENSNTALFKGIAITNTGQINNHAAAQITLKNLVGFDGIRQGTGSSLTNLGKIDLIDCSFSGAFLETSDGTLEVISGGTLNIEIP